MADEEILLSREVDAVRIPSGEKFTLSQGTQVMITQMLGGSYTIVGPFGMARVDEQDGDALGFQKDKSDKTTHKESETSDKTLEDRVWDQLRKVYDPEIPVNIVDLGLVYSMECSNSEAGKRVDVKMTLTAPGCGMGPTIQADAQGKVLQIEEIKEAEVELVWEPAWDQNMISEQGKMKLGMV